MIFKTDKHEYHIVPRYDDVFHNTILCEIWYKKYVPKNWLEKLFNMKQRSSWVNTNLRRSFWNNTDKNNDEHPWYKFTTLSKEEQFKYFENYFKEFETTEALKESVKNFNS